MTKDQGLYNKPSAAVNPGALAARALPHYNTIYFKIAYILLLKNNSYVFRLKIAC